jgi:hypothetical protein
VISEINLYVGFFREDWKEERQDWYVSEWMKDFVRMNMKVKIN